MRSFILLPFLLTFLAHASDDHTKDLPTLQKPVPPKPPRLLSVSFQTFSGPNCTGAILTDTNITRTTACWTLHNQHIKNSWHTIKAHGFHASWPPLEPAPHAPIRSWSAVLLSNDTGCDIERGQALWVWLSAGEVTTWWPFWDTLCLRSAARKGDTRQYLLRDAALGGPRHICADVDADMHQPNSVQLACRAAGQTLAADARYWWKTLLPSVKKWWHMLWQPEKIAHQPSQKDLPPLPGAGYGGGPKPPGHGPLGGHGWLPHHDDGVSSARGPLPSGANRRTSGLVLPTSTTSA